MPFTLSGFGSVASAIPDLTDKASTRPLHSPALIMPATRTGRKVIRQTALQAVKNPGKPHIC